MEYIKNKVLHIVQKPYAAVEEFEREVNAYLMAKGEECNIEPREVPGFHCAYLWSTVRTLRPESLADIFHIRGEDIKCVDCPYLQPQIDARRKYNICKLTGASVDRYSEACETIFAAAWLGRIEVPVREYTGRIRGEIYEGEWQIDREAIAKIEAEAVEALDELPKATRGMITADSYPELLGRA